MTTKKKTTRSKNIPACFRCEYELADATAIQALADGTADEHQQKRALDWIITNASAAYQVAWQPDNERASSFESGRRFVGLEIVKMLKLNTNKLRRDNQ